MRLNFNSFDSFVGTPQVDPMLNAKLLMAVCQDDLTVRFAMEQDRCRKSGDRLIITPTLAVGRQRNFVAALLEDSLRGDSRFDVIHQSGLPGAPVIDMVTGERVKQPDCAVIAHFLLHAKPFLWDFDVWMV